MIVEMRTYTLQPGTLAEVEKRFGASLPAREKHSKLAAFWHSEVGPLNQIIHVWGYDSFEHRASVRGAAQKEEGWPPPIRALARRLSSFSLMSFMNVRSARLFRDSMAAHVAER